MTDRRTQPLDPAALRPHRTGVAFVDQTAPATVLEEPVVIEGLLRAFLGQASGWILTQRHSAYRFTYTHWG